MFSGCKNFNSDLSNWKPYNAENISIMFNGCENFTSDLNKWKLPRNVFMVGIFSDCPLKNNPPKWYHE
jgi:surface protein